LTDYTYPAELKSRSITRSKCYMQRRTVANGNAFLYPVYTMKQTWSKLRAHVVHVYYYRYLKYVCFMFASSRTGY